MSAATCRQLSPATSDVSLRDPGELMKLSEDLAALIAEGLVISFVDDRGVTRYRAIRKAA